jgi:alkylated DNA nucleotide flippase Atl1
VWIVLLVVGSLAALVVLLAIAGLALPRGHVASCAVRVPRSQTEAWAVLTDYAGWPSWAPGVRAMERGPDEGGLPVWRMVSRHGVMPWVIESDDAPRRRVTRIVDDGLPYGGTWTWTVEPDGNGARISVTEEGFIRNPVFRALARFVVGYDATQKAFLRALARRLGAADARIERVR